MSGGDFVLPKIGGAFVRGGFCPGGILSWTRPSYYGIILFAKIAERKARFPYLVYCVSLPSSLVSVCVCMCVWLFVCVYVCLFACMYERERQTYVQTDRQI